MLASVPGHRVYSEAAAPSQAARLLDTGTGGIKGRRLFGAVIAAMTGNSNRTFFKFQSSMCYTYPDVIADMLPSSPVVFLYRNPIEVMASHLVTSSAVCLRQRSAPPVL